jgi:hypothetical protein
MRSRGGWIISLSGLPSPSGSTGSRYSLPPYSTAPSRARMRRTISTYSRVRASGRAKGTPCQPSETCGPDSPSPRRKRPPESVSSVAAVMAVMAGVRAGICISPDPRSMCSVTALRCPSTETTSWPHASATQTESSPARSARRASATCSSGENHGQ